MDIVAGSIACTDKKKPCFDVNVVFTLHTTFHSSLTSKQQSAEPHVRGCGLVSVLQGERG